MNKRTGKQTLLLPTAPTAFGWAGVVGEKEGQGPLRACFDVISEDSRFGEKTWEKAESRMLRTCFELACSKGGVAPGELDAVFSGDLLNQCISSAFAMKDSRLPYLGLYGACSTMAEGLALAALLVDGGYARAAGAVTGSHFCSAERQYRYPLEYGGTRPPTAQWTVTGAGAVLLRPGGAGPKVTHVTFGRIVDAGIKDANDMGAAMAPAAYDTIRAHLADTSRSPQDYDAIFTGDLGALGRDLLQRLFRQDGVELDCRLMDCGVLLFDRNTQGVNAGGSGCGCSASVLGAHILRGMENGVWRRVLFAATGALMSPLTAQQGSSIPGVCHAVAIEYGEG
ncbi:MAG: stage V sporulation protein AD [Oscillospiraceae bacterium]|nr:stage V sporulation protein AD [Oscillospiraceae bacterium]